MENKHIIGIGGIGLGVLLVVLLLFQSTKTPNPGEDQLDLNLNDAKRKASIPVITELQFQELKVGSGSAVAMGDTITVHYLGTFADGTKFDSSYDRNEPFTVTIGTQKVIPGFEQGVVGMKIGGKRKVMIPSKLAYGEAGQGPIPPNTSLIFEIELLSVKPQETPTPSPETTPGDTSATPSALPAPMP